MFIKKIHLKTKRGSILAYSLVVLAIMIGIVTTMSISSVIEKKSASSTDFSVQAYQTADSGIQLAIKGINKDRNATVSNIFSTGCSNGEFKNLIGPNGSTADDRYDVSFYKNEDGTTKITACGELISSIKSIKVVGKYKGAVRALSVVIAQAYTMKL